MRNSRVTEQTELIINSEDRKKSNWFEQLFFTRIFGLLELSQNTQLCEENIADLYFINKAQDMQQEFERVRVQHMDKNLSHILQLLFFYRMIKIYLVQLIQLGCSLLMPLIIKRVLDYIGNEDRELLEGWMWLIIIIIIKIITMLTTSHSKLMIKQVGYDAMSIVSMEIMKKSFSLSLQCSDKPTIGEITNLLQVDASKLIFVINNIISIALIPIQLCISIWFIYREIGITVLVGISIIFLTLVQNHLRGKQLIESQKQVLKHKDSRIKLTNEVFQQIKFIKINAYEPIFRKSIINLREEEMCSLYKRLDFFANNIFIGWLAPQLILSISFTLYVYLGNELTPNKVFPIISLLLMLATSIQILPISINQILDTKLSLNRIQKFLDQSELKLDCFQWFEFQDPSISLQIKNGNFQWSEKSKKPQNTLKNVELFIKPKMFVSLIGDVGSGKSSILQLILGEMIYDEAKEPRPNVIIQGSIAYVGQKAWILNCTVKENILFCKKFHQETYDKAIHYSCLGQDLKILIDSDETMIGEKGVNLSGGQKARISLARAIYSDADIYLLDDPLSAVDIHVANFIMQECFVNYLKDKTRILCTHMLNYCKFTDYIYFLQNGEIINQGDYSQVVQLKQFQDILQKFQNLKEEEEQLTDNQQIQSKQIRIIVNNQPRIKIKEDDQKDELMLKEDRQIGSIEASVFHNYFLYNGGFGSYLVLFTIMALWIITQLTSNIWIANWSNSQNLSQMEQNDYILVYFALGVIQAMLALFRAKIVINSSLKSSTKIHNEIITSLLNAPICQFFERVPIGRIMNRLTKDINSLDMDINMNLSLFSTKISQMISSTILAIITSSKLIIFPFFLFFYLCIYIQRLYMNASRELQRLELISKSPILSYIVESLQGLTYIRAYKAQNSILKNLGEMLDKNRLIVYVSTVANCWFSQVLGLSSLIVNVSAISYCIFYSFNPSFAGLILTYVATLDLSVQQSIDSLSLLENNMISFERCLDFTKIPQEKVDPTQKRIEQWLQDGVIEFQNLSVKYRSNLQCALNQFSCKINSKEKIGIVGRTGAGKSTIILSLLRILEAFEGKILIDNIDISEISLEQLRESITIIQQDAIIFNGTIRQNLDPLNYCNDQEILKVINDCCLTKLLNNRNGLDAQIQEEGSNLSAGEKQLLCIARAILKQSKIVLIDEATANIDIETEKKIQESIKYYFNNCTVITIAHRISTIMLCDRIFVIDQGKLVESGITDELLKDSTSIFYSIYQEVIKNEKHC